MLHSSYLSDLLFKNFYWFGYQMWRNQTNRNFLTLFRIFKKIQKKNRLKYMLDCLYFGQMKHSHQKTR